MSGQPGREAEHGREPNDPRDRQPGRGSCATGGSCARIDPAGFSSPWCPAVLPNEPLTQVGLGRVEWSRVRLWSTGPAAWALAGPRGVKRRADRLGRIG
jgi:hypothetical protein